MDNSADPDPTNAPSRLSTWARIAILLIAPLLLVGPSLRPGHRFLSQAPVQYAPLSIEFPAAAEAAASGANLWTGDRIFPVLTDQRALRERFHDGETWTWDERSGLGLPLLGNAIHGPFYPPNLIQLWIPPDLAAGPLAILTLVLAGAGLWALLARLGRSEPACCFAALALQSVGWGVVNLHYGMKLDAALWLPWCLWAVEGLARGRRHAGPWLAVFTAASFTAGFPPIAVFVAGATFVTAGLRLRERKAWLQLVGGLVCGGVLASIQLLPTLAASLDSYRTPKDAATLVEEAAAPGSTLGLFAPELFGSPLEPTPPFGPIAAWWLSDSADWERSQGVTPLEWTTYSGLAVVVLAWLALWASPGAALAPLLLLLLGLGFAQGWPLIRSLYHLPGLDGGAPTRAACVAWIAWPWLAAIGIDGLLGSAPARRRAALGGALATAALAAAFFWLGDGTGLIAEQEARYVADHGKPLDEVRAVLEPDSARVTVERLGLGLALSAALAFALSSLAILRLRRPRLIVPGLLFAVLLAEALTFSRPHVHARDLGGLEVFPESEIMRVVAETTGEGRLARFDTSVSGLGDVERLARPNLPFAYGVGDISAYVAFTPRPTVDHFTAADEGFRARSGVGGIRDLDLIDAPALDEAQVTCVLAREPIEHPRLELVASWPGFAVHEREVRAADDASRALAEVRANAESATARGRWLSALALVVLIAWILAENRRSEPCS
ncbi:MAG: hypothetical protein ACYSWX_04330 [Planctomycetota bacterium]